MVIVILGLVGWIAFAAWRGHVWWNELVSASGSSSERQRIAAAGNMNFKIER
jgi:hypothetical protein